MAVSLSAHLGVEQRQPSLLLLLLLAAIALSGADFPIALSGLLLRSNIILCGKCAVRCFGRTHYAAGRVAHFDAAWREYPCGTSAPLSCISCVKSEPSQ